MELHLPLLLKPQLPIVARTGRRGPQPKQAEEDEQLREADTAPCHPHDGRILTDRCEDGVRAT